MKRSTPLAEALRTRSTSRELSPDRYALAEVVSSHSRPVAYSLCTQDMLFCGVQPNWGLRAAIAEPFLETLVATATRITRSSAQRDSRRRSKNVRATRVGKVRKAFWLDPRLLDEARATLGASTEREAVEIALDLVGFRKQLVRGARALRGLDLSRID